MKYNDPIANVYYTLSEMAIDIGYSEKQQPDDIEYERHNPDWNSEKTWDGLELLSNKHSSGTDYKTLDHETQTQIHRSEFRTAKANSVVPFDHEYQADVAVAYQNKLPKYYATDLAYSHFKKSTLPLRTSDQQYSGGQTMWKELTKRAINDNHYVYAIDSESKLLHPIDNINVERHLSGYVRDNQHAGRQHHLVISKTPISAWNIPKAPK